MYYDSRDSRPYCVTICCSVSLHKSVPIKQQVLLEHRYLKYTSYLFVLTLFSFTTGIAFLTDFVLRYAYKLCSSLINIFKFSFFCPQPPNSKVRILLALFSPLHLTLYKYFPIFLCPLHLYSLILSYKLRSRSHSTIYSIQIRLFSLSF